VDGRQVPLFDVFKLKSYMFHCESGERCMFSTNQGDAASIKTS
jgi:hypothetical protein